jgi:hypothetical protein
MLARRYQLPLGHHPKRDKARRAQLKKNRINNEKE